MRSKRIGHILRMVWIHTITVEDNFLFLFSGSIFAAQQFSVALGVYTFTKQPFTEAITLEKLFSYGTLQLENVQKKTFGRLLTGSKDILRGYVLYKLTRTAKSAVAPRFLPPERRVALMFPRPCPALTLRRTRSLEQTARLGSKLMRILPLRCSQLNSALGDGLSDNESLLRLESFRRWIRWKSQGN